ncbi:MAG TPA: phosphatase PAP2 family protein [Acetobacteraceae bacterium]
MFFADRVDLPFITVDSLETSIFVPGNTAFYADNRWDPFWKAWLVLADFASVQSGTQPAWKTAKPVPTSAATNTLSWQDGTTTRTFTVTEPTSALPAQFGNLAPGPTNFQQRYELLHLGRAARDERTDAMGEIVAQASEFLTYFMELMAVTPASHPQTVRLMNIASLIALYCCLYWKGFYRRMRPSQLLPALMPPISVPGHASFPSGHATQSWLVSLSMQQALPGFVLDSSTHLPGTPAAASLCAALAPGLTQLALRIARNREIAGLHYPTDSVGGRTLANQVFGNLLSDDSSSAPVRSYRDALLAARAELAA